MRRLLRGVFNGAAVVSAVLLVAVCVLWARSYRRADGITHFLESHPGDPSESYFQDVTSDRGMLTVYDRRVDPPVFHAGEWTYSSVAAYDPNFLSVGTVRWSFAGCSRHVLVFNTTISGPVTVRDEVIQFPHSALALLLTPLPLLSLVSFLRRRRYRGAGLCPGCGYDMRATPSRCPECGFVPTALAASQ